MNPISEPPPETQPESAAGTGAIERMRGWLAALLESEVPVSPALTPAKTGDVAKKILSSLGDVTAKLVDRMLADTSADDGPGELDAAAADTGVMQKAAGAVYSCRAGDGTAFRIDSIKVRNFRGIRDLSLAGLHGADVIVLRGSNGMGKTSLLQALGRGTAKVTAKEVFAGTAAGKAAKSGEIDVTYHPVSETEPAFRALGKEHFQTLVMPDLNAVLTTKFELDSALSAAAGATAVSNRLEVARRLVDSRANARGSLAAGADSLLRTANAGAPPPGLENEYDKWKAALWDYRREVGAAPEQPVPVDLAAWNARAGGLWQKVALDAWNALVPFDEGKAGQTVDRIRAAIDALKPPPDVKKAIDWLQGIQQELTTILPAFTMAVNDLGSIRTDLLKALSDCLRFLDVAPVGSPEADALAAVHALASEAGLAPLPGANPEEDGGLTAMAERAKQALVVLLKRADREIEAIDARSAAMRSALEWLKQTEGAGECPVCTQAIDRATLMVAVRTALAHADSTMGPLVERRDAIRTANAWVGKKCEDWGPALVRRNEARQKLLETLNRMASPPVGLGSDVEGVLADIISRGRNAVDNGNGWTDRVLVQVGRALETPSSDALTALHEMISGFSTTVEALRRDLRCLESLGRVLAADTRACAIPWANQSERVREDRLWNLAVNAWKESSEGLAADLQIQLDHLKAEIVNNQKVRDLYADLVKHGGHVFLTGDQVADSTPEKLSEGFKVLHALAAVVAVAAAPTPGNDAGFLLLDEPTNGLDPGLRRKVGGFLGAECPKQLVVATYDPEFAGALMAEAHAKARTVRVFDLAWNPADGTKATPTPIP